jgi:hypothetical protein
MSSVERQALDTGLIRHAFRLLSSIELGGTQDWAGPDIADNLQSRVELLAVLLNIVPRDGLRYLAVIAADWQARFPVTEPVSARTLREAAHAVLLATDGRQPADEAAHDINQIEAFLDVKFGQETSPEASASARLLCANALLSWRSMLRCDCEWTTLPGVGTDDERVPIEDVYVELYASPREDESAARHLELLTRSSRSSGKRAQGETACVGISSMVARTLELCVVVGEPGSGKSTLIQWLAWATNRGMLPDFDLGIVVRLRHYASLLANRPGLTPVELFLESQLPGFDWDESAECLRDAASRTRRVMLLLDGWDEVPAELRERTRAGIHRELPHFVVVVTSRASGLPWQHFAKGHGEFYEIAGLSPQAIRSFVNKRLPGAEQQPLAQRVVARIEVERDLRAMAANPFLLGLLVKVFSRPGCIDENPTMADLYQDIVTWVADQYRQVGQGTDKLVGSHFRALESLSFQMIFNEQSPRYVFRRQELDDLLGHLSSDPLLDSRFVTWVDRKQEGWSFLHATLEEYLAARHLSGLADEERNRNWDRAACSQSRLVALEFFAGLEPMRSVTRTRAEFWLSHPDRFGMILLRLARLAKAGQWARCFPDIVATLCEKLWAQITNGADWRLARLFVEGFAELDAPELVRLAVTSNRVDGRVWEAVIDLVPLETVKDGGLYAKLPKPMRDHLTVRSREMPSLATRDRVARQLADEALPKSELQRLLDEAGLIADANINLLLLERLRNAQDQEISETLVMALAPQFGALPNAAVVGLLIEPTSFPITVRQLASASLSHRKGRGAKLEPDDRDRLLRRLAAVKPEDIRVGPLLDALTGFPIRDGGRLIGEIASDRNLASAIRISAIDVLETVAESGPIERVVAGVVNEPIDAVAHALVELGVKRNAMLPLDWLEGRITSTGNTVTRRPLATAYLRMVNRPATGDGLSAEVRVPPYLLKNIRQGLTGTSTDNDELAWQWASALRSDGSVLPEAPETEEIRGLARNCLQGFVNGADVSLGAVRLATAALRGETGEDSIWVLRCALDAILAFLKRAKEKRELREFELAAVEIGEDIADNAVETLLGYPVACESVQDVLANRARDVGWLIFDDQILDADGNVVASTNVARRSGVELTKPMLDELLEELGESPRNAILSFWLMTKMHGLCTEEAGYREINARLRRVANGDEGDDMAIEAVRGLYGRRVPHLDTWRRALAHAAAKLKLTPNGAQLLYNLGLPRGS